MLSCYPVADFPFLRSLRPYPISKKRLVPAHIEKPDWAIDVSSLVDAFLNVYALRSSS